MNSFLACTPNVFVLRDSYQIVVNLRESGVCRLRIGDRVVDEAGSGVFRTEARVRRFSLPQALLDRAESYTVCFWSVPERKDYFTAIGEGQEITYPFRPVRKSAGIRGVFISDVHRRFTAAAQAVAACGPVDFMIVNGDIAEMNSPDCLTDLNRFIGEISRGEVPVIVGRGNHDTRGRLAEYLPDHLATDGKKTYYPFRLGPIAGVMLDWGEDKPDGHAEYGGVNNFEPFRRAEAADLRRMRLPDAPYKLALCHVGFMTDSAMRGPFDIMPEVYRSLGRSLERLAPDLFLCGHTHKFALYPAGTAEGCKYPHSYPIVECCALDKTRWSCTAFDLYPDRTEFFHADDTGSFIPAFTLPRV